jgi:hypothetical protein
MTTTDYWVLHSTTVDALRSGTSGVQSSDRAAHEALTRLAGDPQPLLALDTVSRPVAAERLADVVERATAGEVTLDDAAHLALDRLRDVGAPVPPRALDDAHPDL